MDTSEIVAALKEQIHPDLILAIDALAARSSTRLGTTIQLTDTGIHPGSGVGNHRHSLTQKTLGVPILAIGVPTVVSAAAIVTDTLDSLLTYLKTDARSAPMADTLSQMNGEEQYQTITQLMNPTLGSMFVTPKDIDETIRRVSYTISEGINMALFPDYTT
jgi:spore protease